MKRLVKKIKNNIQKLSKRKPSDIKLDEIHCLSISFNPLLEEAPQIFKYENKKYKNKFSQEILENKLNNSFSNLVLIKTCQRIELYITSNKEKSDLIREFSLAYNRYFSDDCNKIIKTFNGTDCLVHLTKLACGFESFIIGEPEIYHQIRKLFNQYRKEKHTNKEIDYIFKNCLDLSKVIKKKLLRKHENYSYLKILLELFMKRGTKSQTILIAGDGALARSLTKELQKIGMIVKNINKLYYDDYNYAGIDLIVNCDPSLRINRLINLNGSIFVDFSIPSPLDNFANKKNYFSIKDFKNPIEANNNLLGPSMIEAISHIKICIDAIVQQTRDGDRRFSAPTLRREGKMF